MIDLKPFRNSDIAHFATTASHENGQASDTNLLFPKGELDNAQVDIASWQHYQPTALHQLDALADALGIASIHYKDESTRFGLGSFKALGGAYAVKYLLTQALTQALAKQGAESTVTMADIDNSAVQQVIADTTIVTATDGNHGRSVAWGCQRYGVRCQIYIHAGVSEFRAQAMRDLGAEVMRISGNYDDSVRQAAADAATNGWHVVSDTSYDGYEDVPLKVMQGYTTMISELVEQSSKTAFTHVFVQGGVGGLAAAVCAGLYQRLPGSFPKAVVVEPRLADCLYQSARNGKATDVYIEQETIMAGLSCGEVSTLAWRVLQELASDYLTIDDELVAPVMRYLGHLQPNIVAGESAVAGLAGMIAATQQAELKAALGLNAQSKVLIIGSEGDTDPELYQQLVA